jgi:PIN domain nuclease of toxin-antitoxin system
VLDAWALLAFLRGEEGADKVESLLLDSNNRSDHHELEAVSQHFPEIEIIFFR